VKKYIFIILIFSLGTLLILGSRFLLKNNEVKTIPPADQISEDSLAPKKEIITMFLVGDIMLDRGTEYIIKKEGNGNFKFPFLKIADEFNNSDIVFGNLEGPISDKGTRVGSIYSFRADPKAIEGLNYSGFNVLSLANNHALDYGKEALKDTFSRLKLTGISYVGAGLNENEAFFPVIKEIKDTKIAFLAYTNLGSQYWKATPESSGIAWISDMDLERVKTDIQNAKSQADIVIISLHSGEEYSQNITNFQTDFSKMAIDAGADLIIGHHPHVVQKNELYNGKYIFYSLGNFIFDQSFSEETMEGEIVKVLIEDNKIKKVIPIKTEINEFYQPYLND